MRNEKLIALMNLKGMTQATLSKETHIPGASVTKLLTSDESLLLYWFQNTYREGQAAILKRAKEEYNKTQKEILKKVTSLEEPKDNPGDFDQLSLELRT